MYIDDWVSRIGTYQRTSLYIQTIVNLEKSELIPKQKFQFIGVVYDMTLQIMYPPPDRYLRIQRAVNHALTVTALTLKEWQSLLGLLQSTVDQVPLGRLHTRPLHTILASQCPMTSHSETIVPWSDRFISPLQWWLERSQVMKGFPFGVFHPQMLVTIDSSAYHWGAELSWLQDNQPLPLSAMRSWDDQTRALHINYKELLAVWEALQAFEMHVLGLRVKMKSDNKTVVSLINRQGTVRSKSLHERTSQILLWSQARDIRLQACYIPGILNVVADKLSRPNQVIHTEWSLKTSVVQTLFQMWDRPQVDLFATRDNCKLPIYVSPVRDPQAFAVDAMSTDWRGMFAYAYPPAPLLPLVLQKIQASLCKVILVAPYWPRMVWFPTLVELAIGKLIRLPDTSDL